jgi:hypothetical protein
MANTTFLGNATINVLSNAGGATSVDLSDQASKCEITVGRRALDSTTFGDAGERKTPGLKFWEASIDLYLSYGAGEVEATVYDIVNSGGFTLTVSPSGTTESASNPEYTLSYGFVESFQPIMSTQGELSVLSFTATGGEWTRDITAP